MGIRIHADDNASACLKVSNHITHQFLRNLYFNFIYRLEDLWISLLESFFESHHACNLKADVVAIHRMHLAIVNNNPYVTNIRTRDRSFLHLLHYAFLYGWNEACIN